MPARTRSSFRAKPNRVLGIPLTAFLKEAAIKDVLADTAGTSLLGLADANASILVGSSGSGASISEKAVARICLPSDYRAGKSLQVKLYSLVNLLPTVGATVLVALQKLTVTTGTPALGTTVVSTTARTLGLTAAEFTFECTEAGLAAGDEMALGLTLAVNDTGGAIASVGKIWAVRLFYGSTD